MCFGVSRCFGKAICCRDGVSFFCNCGGFLIVVFSSTVFLFLFLPGLMLLYFFPFCKSRKWKNAVLLIFSIAFYAWGEPLFVWVMLAYIILNWLLVLIMDKSKQHRKAWLTAAIVLDVLLIGIFKYASFLSENLALLTGNDRLIVNIALPVGISFFTFQLMSYVFDVYYGKAFVQDNPLYVALYISLFPQLIAGPIVRYRQIENEILDRHESFSEIWAGMKRFIYGLAKKVLIANFVAQIADNAFDNFSLQTPSVLFAWLGAIAYTLQIYFDFSGYSDMAIGLGQIFGFHFLENFNYPYIAGSVTDFWRRWHISLSTWFRDYVYIPLGGNRVKKSRWILNLFIVWLLTGIWHGANWTFVLWGLIYFVVLLFEKITGIDSKNSILTHVWTLLIVVIAWVFFRAADLRSGWDYLSTMFGFSASAFIGLDFIQALRNTWSILIIALFGTTPLVSGFFNRLRQKGLAWIENSWLIIIFCLSLIEVISSTYNPFIYFNF